MPTYQYACTECDDQLEVHQSFTDDALTVCPTCEGRLRKVFNAVGVVFKGSGFYKTDSRQQAKASAGKESGDSGKGSGDSGTSGESGKSGGDNSAGNGSKSGSGEKSGGSSGSSSSSAA